MAETVYVTQTEWKAKGQASPFIEAYCPRCHLLVTIEKPTENASFSHCGIVETVPEATWNQLCGLRNGVGFKASQFLGGSTDNKVKFI